MKHVFGFDFPVEKIVHFAKWCAETSKPFFEKYLEIKSYDVYQTMVGKPMFVKEVIYEDLSAFASMWQKTTTDTEIQRVNAEFFSYAINLESKLIIEIV